MRCAVCRLGLHSSALAIGATICTACRNRGRRRGFVITREGQRITWRPGMGIEPKAAAC